MNAGSCDLTFFFSGQDPSSWERQILAPPGDLIATPQLHFDLGNLIPDTTYSIFIKVLLNKFREKKGEIYCFPVSQVILRGISNAVESPILTVRTPPGGEQTTLPPQIPVDPELTTGEINSTWILLKWRKFTDFELQFIDGLQLRYRENDGKVKSLFHFHTFLLIYFFRYFQRLLSFIGQ